MRTVEYTNHLQIAIDINNQLLYTGFVDTLGLCLCVVIVEFFGSAE